MRYRLIIILLFFSGLLSGQINYNITTWIIKGNLTSLMDGFTFPVPQLSVEKKISDYFSVSAEGGYQVYNFNQPDTSYFKPRGFKANIEFRYYIPKFYKSPWAPKLEAVYLGLRPFYRQNKYTGDLAYRTIAGGTKWDDDSFGVKNVTYGLNCLIGFQRSVSDRIIFDFHGGIGVMYRDVVNSNNEFNSEAGDILNGGEFIQFFEKMNLESSSGIWPNILFGFRIGYKL